MKCLDCGEEMVTERETYLYDPKGIRATLEGVNVHRCKACGDFEVEIPQIEELNRTLASFIIHQSERLSGSQIRFLRKSLGWSGKDLAEHMGVDPATVSRWESGDKPMGPSTDRCLRMAVKVGAPVEDYSVHDLKKIGADRAATAPPLRLRQANGGWQPAAA